MRWRRFMRRIWQTVAPGDTPSNKLTGFLTRHVAPPHAEMGTLGVPGGGDGYPRDMIEQVETELREARLARDSEQVGALTMLLSALKDAEKANGGSLDDAGAIQVMTRERKKRVEAAESFREGGREDAALKEEAELTIIDRHLPAQLAPEELADLIAAAIAEAGATEPKDLGSVMKILQPKTAGRADGKAVSTAVREALGA